VGNARKGAAFSWKKVDLSLYFLAPGRKRMKMSGKLLFAFVLVLVGVLGGANRLHAAVLAGTTVLFQGERIYAIAKCPAD
jgi:hypothetical protein